MLISVYMESTFLTLLNPIRKNIQKMEMMRRFLKYYFWFIVLRGRELNDFQRGLKFGLIMRILGFRQSFCLRSLTLNKFLKITSCKRKLVMWNYDLAANDNYKSLLNLVVELKSYCVVYSITQLSLS